MLSKNNTYLKKKKIANQAQRFGLRKLSIGTVSVLLGTLLFMGNSQASADTTTDTTSTGTEEKTASTTTDLNASQVALSSTGSQAAASESSATVSQATSSSTTATSQAATNSATVASDTTTDTAKTTTPATSTVAQSETAATATPTAKTNASITTAEATAATTASSQATSNDAASAEGKITDEGKTKGLTDSDVTPGMSNANGASLVLDNSSKIPSGYKADPTEGRYTFGILSLGPVSDSKLTSYNQTYGVNYYIRLSTAAKAINGVYDDTVYIQLVDADQDKVIWETAAKPGDVNKTIDALQATNGQPFQYSYSETTVNGVTSKSISFNASPYNTGANGKMYSAKVYETGSSAKRTEATIPSFNYPSASTLETRYIAKDAAGNETILATYDETGRPGSTYTASGLRGFVGYDLVSVPSKTTGDLESGYKVGDLQVFTPRTISNYLQIVRTQLVTNTDGTVRISYRLAKIGASINDINDPSVWKVVFESEELKPGEMSDTGNSQTTYNGVTKARGGFAIDPSYKLTEKDPEYISPSDPSYDATYAFKGGEAVKKAGFTFDQLDGWQGKVINYVLVNPNPAGQEPVDYYYAPQGQVRVNYITNDGTVIQAPVTAYENSSNNTTYNVSSSTYKPETITVNGKTYRYVKSDKSKGNTGTTEVNGYTYNVTPSDETGRISSNTVNDVYFVYEQVTYHTEADTPKTVTRTIEYYDSVTGEPIPSNLESTVTQTATLTRNKIYDDQGNFIGYGTVSADGSSYTIDDSWKVDAQTWTQQDSADLSDYGYTAPDRASVAAVTVDGNTTNATEKVYYGHQTTPVTPTNPGTPGKPINPKGDVTYPDGVAKDDLTDTVTRTINYVDAKGNPVKGGPNGEETITQTVTFERTAIVDKVTGKVLGYDTDNDGKVDTESGDRAWSPLHGEFDEVESKTPAEVGFDHVDRAKVNVYGVEPGDSDIVEKVVYSNDPMVVAGTIQYIDDTTGTLLDEKTLPEGEVGTKIKYTTKDKIKNYQDLGYELVSNDFSDGTQTYAKEGNDFIVHLKHATKTITPEDPATPGDPINPKGDVTYPDGVTKNDLTETVKRTINYVDAKGNPVKGAPDGTSSYVQTVTFKRAVVIDKVTGNILGYDTNNDGKADTESADRAWQPATQTLAAVKSADPSSVGYDNVDIANVSSQVVTPDQDDTTVTVTYSNNQVSGTIKYVDDTTGVELDSDPLPSGEIGSLINYTTKDKIKGYENQGYELVSNDFTDGSQVYEKTGNNFVVHLKHATKTITPEDPATPGNPINPNDPNSPVYPTEADHKNLIKAATQTIHYVGAGDQTPPDKTQTKEDAFTRTVTIDKVTGKVLSTSDWQGSNTFGTEDTPVVDGYHADKKTAGGLTATVDNPDVEETVTYTPNGKLIPVDENGTPIPGTDTPTYTTDPDDPTKVLNPTVPSVDGWKPKDNQPGDSITPADPGKDTKVPYVQVVSGTIKYVDDTTNATLDQAPLPEGEVGTKINYTTADKIKNYQDLGYELVSNDFTDGSQVYEKTGNDFIVHLKHATKTITPEDPATPGDPINPKGNAEYPNGVAKDDLTETVKRTINYVDDQGKPVNGSPDGTSSYVQTVTFKRTAVVDKVTGKLLGYDTNNDGQVDTTDAERAWSPARDEFAEVASKTPAEVGFTHVDRPTVASHVVLPGDQDATVTVVYSKDSLAVAGTIQYIDDTTGALLDEKALPEGEVGAKINYTTADKIKNYQDLGYELVSNNFSDGTQTYAKAGNDFVVHLKHATKTITPEDPATPGQPINPKGNAEYPNGVAKDDLTDTVTRTINYVDADGNPVKGGPNGETTIKQTVTFKHAAVIDKVTGQLLGYDTNNDGQVDTTDAERAWSPMHGEFDEVESKTPAEVGYLHVDRPKVNVYGVVPGDQDIVEKVVYSNDPMVVAGTIQYIDDTTGVLLDEDVLPEGEVGTKISYTTADKIKNYENKGYELVSNNFTDGAQTYSKDGNDFVVHLKHKTQTITPNDPDLVTPGEPINPNDPNSPVYPPATARENLIKAATQTIHYVGAGDQTPADKVQTKEDAFTRTVTIDKVTGKVLSTSDWQGSETFGTENTPVVDGYHADKKTAGGLTATVADPNVEETVTYTPNAKIVPVDPNGNPIPGADTPTYPTDPTDPTKVVPNEPIPDVPGYTPVDPSPITPTDPGKDTPVPYTQNQYGLTEQFVDEDGNELSPSVSKGSSYKYGDAFDVTGDAKVINGYVLVKQENTKGTFGNGDETAKFVYKKLGRIIPVDPNGNPIPGADTPIYQNDPNDPSKVVPNEPTPTVPGYTPSTPSVTPADPTKDTPVPYTKNETPTNPSEPTTPANPTNPSEPTAPGTPTNPTEPSPAVPGQTTPANQQAASSASEDESATLPQTGNDQNETAAAAGLGLAGLSSLLALFGTRKKRHED
ncbi:mucin-binding protein [Limosilactobacillus mucosae]|uniref:mucin-binding protein n=1 Tax=Limosilactobacillus mucosae TaxID=97478 RepID=UPI0022E82F3A|nr:YSIRK-type signal peptide-containing protein [Limosilactobacillus mucosae]